MMIMPKNDFERQDLNLESNDRHNYKPATIEDNTNAPKEGAVDCIMHSVNLNWNIN